MNKEELQKKLNELEERIFLVEMQDTWSNEDKELYKELNEEMKKIKILLQEIKERN